MKRIVLLLTVVSLLLFSFSVGICESDGLDIGFLDDLSTDQLIELKTAIDKKLSADDKLLGYTPWCDTGLGKLLPDPDEVMGKKVTGEYALRANGSGYFNDRLFDVSNSDFAKYASACKMVGFDQDVRETGIMFEAKNADGYKIMLANFGTGDDGVGTCTVNIFG